MSAIPRESQVITMIFGSAFSGFPAGSRNGIEMVLDWRTVWAWKVIRMLEIISNELGLLLYFHMI
jgi:hypothetical protein